MGQLTRVGRFAASRPMYCPTLGSIGFAVLLSHWCACQSRGLHSLPRGQRSASCLSAHLAVRLHALMLHAAPPQAYRLMCMMSVVGNGLKSRVLEQLRKAVLHTYGVEEISALLNLDALGLLRSDMQTNRASHNRCTDGRWSESYACWHVLESVSCRIIAQSACTC